MKNEAEMRKVHLMSRKINVQVDASKRLGPQDHLWRYVGYDECN